jgi:hypothetical protein
MLKGEHIQDKMRCTLSGFVARLIRCGMEAWVEIC